MIRRLLRLGAVVVALPGNRRDAAVIAGDWVAVDADGGAGTVCAAAVEAATSRRSVRARSDTAVAAVPPAPMPPLAGALESGATAHLDPELPFGQERRVVWRNVPVLSYRRPGAAPNPLVVFLTGGGVLARIVYGHPGADPADFLDHWLEQAGWGLVAPSYPGDHPVFGAVVPTLGFGAWADIVADEVVAALGDDRKRPVIACGWSMGGRYVFALNRELKRRGIALDLFVSLAGTPPFPRIESGPPQERLAANGLWDLAAGVRDGIGRDERWRRELAGIASREGRTVLAPDVFLQHYRTNVPPNLHGPDLAPFYADAATGDLAQALTEAGTYRGEDHPLCAAIAPRDRSDFQHALVDEAVWGSISVAGLVHNEIQGLPLDTLSEECWDALKALMHAVPHRLTRSVGGGHFFFLGRGGAEATVAGLRDLHDEARRLCDQIATLTGGGGSVGVPANS